MRLVARGQDPKEHCKGSRNDHDAHDEENVGGLHYRRNPDSALCATLVKNARSGFFAEVPKGLPRAARLVEEAAAKLAVLQANETAESRKAATE
ncbi:MAG: hypothetical protein WCA59_18585 [Candidatus Binataceae bacterium]